MKDKFFCCCCSCLEMDFVYMMLGWYQIMILSNSHALAFQGARAAGAYSHTQLSFICFVLFLGICYVVHTGCKCCVDQAGLELTSASVP